MAKSRAAEALLRSRMGPESCVPSGARPTPADRLVALLIGLGLDHDPGAAQITGGDPVLPCRYPVGEGAAAVLAAIGLVAARLHERHGAPAQGVTVDVRHAAAHLRGFLDQCVDGEVLDPDPTGKLPLVGLYAAADGAWVQVYGVFAPLRERTLAVLGLPNSDGNGDAGPSREAIGAAVARWPADELAEALNAVGAPGAVARTSTWWEAHAQGGALRALPPVVVERIGDGPPPVAVPGEQPLDGVRVLDLTRIVAGPVCGRTLAEHGADVLSITAARLPSIRRAQIDTDVGKRAALLDPSRPTDRARLQALAARADVVLQNARPAVLARRGLGPQELAARRPGLIYASIDAYGQGGPWSERSGFEPIAQACTGWAVEHASADGAPRIVPALPCDYTTGFLTALGVLIALERRAREGGSWHVRTSLCRTAMWLRDQPGRVDPAAVDPGALGAARTRDLRRPVTGDFGTVDQLTSAVRLSATPPQWPGPARRPGADPADFVS